jgi:hypothetical protein
MTCSLTLKGNMVIGDPCVSSCGSSGQKITPLGLGCGGGVTYGAVSSTDCAIAVTTTGALGAEYVELPGVSGVSEIYFLHVKSSSTVWLLIDGAPAELQLSGGTYPTGFAGGEAFGFTVDGTSVAGTFTVAAQSVDQVVTELNQAAVAAGLPYLPFSAVGSQVKVTGATVGPNGSIAVDTTNATIGATSGDSAAGAGEILKINGVALIQFESTTAPSAVYISGSASVEVTAAGAA